ncbi:MAG: chemotaxis protein CheW [Desulfobacterales bacterium]
MNTQHIWKKAEQRRVLLIPARVSEISGQPVSFLFTLGQIEDIVREMPVWTVPFAPSFVKGLTLWRNQPVPVICLEECLGMPGVPASDFGRMVVVRTRQQRGILYADTDMRLIHVPEFYAPAEEIPWISGKHLVHGVYACAHGFLVAVRMEAVLSGQCFEVPLPA